jgi:hypothetical protein
MMKNNEVEIHIKNNNGKLYQRIFYEGDTWKMIVESTGNVYLMSGNQVLSHILPPLVEGSKSKTTIEFIKRGVI